MLALIALACPLIVLFDPAFSLLALFVTAFSLLALLAPVSCYSFFFNSITSSLNFSTLVFTVFHFRVSFFSSNANTDELTSVEEFTELGIAIICRAFGPL